MPAPTTAPSTSAAIRSIAASAARRAQRHLDRRQPAAHERVGQRDGVVEVVDHDDRDDRRQADEVLDGQRVTCVMQSPPAARRGEHGRALVGAADALAEGREQLAAGAVASACSGIHGSRSPRSTSTSSRPVSASTRTTSPSRTRDSGPPAAASGVQWIAAGTLPDAPRHAAVGDERDAVAAVHAARRARG